MGIDVKKTNNLASQLLSAADEVRRGIRKMTDYKTSLSNNWQGAEVGYMKSGIDKANEEAESIIRELQAIANDMKSAAAAIKKEEEAAAKRAAEEKAAKERAAAQKKAEAEKKKRIQEAQKKVDEATAVYEKLLSEKDAFEKKIRKEKNIIRKAAMTTELAAKIVELEEAEKILEGLREALKAAQA